MLLLRLRRSNDIEIDDQLTRHGSNQQLITILTNPQITNAPLISAVTSADHLIAASVSNWGSYALAAAIAVIYTNINTNPDDTTKTTLISKEQWINRCLPSKAEEISLLQRCVDAGCRDGVSGKMEATVDGMPLSTSLDCLEKNRSALTPLQHKKLTLTLLINSFSSNKRCQSSS